MKKLADKQVVLDGLALVLDIQVWETQKTTVKQIDNQLDWHRRDEGEKTEIAKKKDLPRKELKLAALIEAVKRYNARHSDGDVDEGVVETGDYAAAVNDSSADFLELESDPIDPDADMECGF